jgi:hypothetical protein
MKKTIVTLFAFAILQCHVSAQSVNGVSLLLGKPLLGKGIAAQHQSRLENQLLAALTAGEGSMGAKFSAFAVLPSLEIVEWGKIEGMKSKPTVKLSLSMKLQNAQSGEVLDVQEATLTGVGANEDEAISKAIGSIRRNQPQLGKALKEFQAAILDFYENSCANLQDNASDLASRQQYREAFALLQSVPQGTPCFTTVQATKNDFYQKTQVNGCAETLAKANAAKAANDFSGALRLLGSVDAESPCFGEAKALTAALESTVDEDLKTRYEWLFKFHSTGAEAEAARWNAMNSLFLGWLREGKQINLLNQ